MATLAFSALGSAVGGSFLPAIGGISGAALGQATGALVGRYVDQALFATSGQSRLVEGPRLEELSVSASTEGAPIPRSYGRVRLGGQVIWATNFEEEIITRTQSSGASGGKGGSSSGGAAGRSIEYRYYANFAVALAEGPITRLGRVWANGTPLNLGDYNHRIYVGSEDQQPDSLMEAKEGTGLAPAYRGVAYIVFERMPLAEFGNRIPQLNFEIFRSLDDFEQKIPAVTLIPSAGEYVYENEELIRDDGNGNAVAVNTHTHQGGSDWDVSLNQLQADLPNAGSVSLFVSWFGTDLRAAQCQLRPGVDNRDKVILGRNWQVAGESRASAHLVSLDEDRPAYGGTPSDETVVNAITDLTARGLKVTFNPFILMDIPTDNSLNDPWSDNPYQPRYPWRGRITVDPAPNQVGTVDKTATATTQLAAFIGTAAPGDFAVNGTSVTYSGPAEWTLRRMLLHYAHLCAAAGGVDSFLLCSELKSLTTIRNEAGDYPFVDALANIAADLRAILGPATKLTYAADWSEYFGHQPADGTGDVFYHLDPLWSDANIDAIGIDCYWPLSDWRRGQNHLDAASHSDIYQLDYLKNNITGGEGFDWYYASDEDRTSQTRTPISDGSGKPWTFRYKDIKSWWSNTHYNRPAGIEEATPTGWTPGSKPIWFMEIGCPAVHLGANQPNVFVDPKSSESNLPYFSDGGRDDFIQRRYITAMLDHFTPGAEGFDEENNPAATLYTGRMVDPERIYVYTWDARPYPAYPASLDIWGDGENWLKGHWLTGRTGSVSLSALVERLMADYGFESYETPQLNGIIEGYVIDHLMAARDALQTLELAFFFDSFESEGEIKFRHRGRRSTGLNLGADDLVETDPAAGLFELNRAQETELPRAAKIKFIDGDHEYLTRTLEGRQTIGETRRIAIAELPIVMEAEKVQSLASKWVEESWAAREEGSFALPPSRLALEPSDIVTLQVGGSEKQLRITEINDNLSRSIKTRSVAPALYEDSIAAANLPRVALPKIYGPSNAVFLDLPGIGEGSAPHAGFVAATQQPWPGAVAFYRSPEDSGFTLNQTVNAPATMGSLDTELEDGPTGRWDYGSAIEVTLGTGTLASVSRLAALSGENHAAIRHDNEIWELIQFQTATLIGEGRYRLTGLLRGQQGTEDALSTVASPGAPFVLIDEALAPVSMTIDDIGLAYNWRFGPAPHSLGHPSYQAREFTFTGRGLRPLSPVHIRAENDSGDLLIRWIRRTRIGGDSWAVNEIPLGETEERYRIEILDGSTVIRSAETSTATYDYSAAEQVADWGAPQPGYKIRIAQISELFGPGAPHEVTIQNV